MNTSTELRWTDDMSADDVFRALILAKREGRTIALILASEEQFKQLFLNSTPGESSPDGQLRFRGIRVSTDRREGRYGNRLLDHSLTRATEETKEIDRQIYGNSYTTVADGLRLDPAQITVEMVAGRHHAQKPKVVRYRYRLDSGDEIYFLPLAIQESQYGNGPEKD